MATLLAQNNHYVNFLRGTPEAWERLREKDSDTLYFICERDKDYGTLYLGNKIIASNINNLTLEEIAGILEEDLDDGQILMYDKDGKRWVNRNIALLLEPFLKVFRKGECGRPGMAGLVPAPSCCDGGKFLRGDGKWVNISTDLYWGEF